MLTRLLKQQIWHELFEAGVFFKALNSSWELAGGIFLLTRLHSWLTHIFLLLSNSELLGDHDDLLFRFVFGQVTHLDSISTRFFVGFYLLFHGLMNAFLAYNLFRNRLWAYPVSIAFTSTFLLYQLYRLSHTHSPILLVITLFDIFFIALTFHEYRYQAHRKN